MTREEAIAIIRKEYLCVDRDCDIERSCGKCDLMMPSKEPILQAYKMAIEALEQEPCEDAISRKAVLDTTICEGISCNECSFNEIDGEPGCLLHARIDELPSGTQKSETVTEFADRCRECGVKYGKIKAEIIELRSKQNVGVMECLDIIDKYRAGSEK